MANFGALETPEPLKEDLIDLYRFAVLLTGSPERARHAIKQALLDPTGELPQLRGDRHRKAWMVNRIRHLTAAETPEADRTVPGCFARLAEPARSALALFYLDFLSIRDMAQILKMPVEELAKLLGEARGHLRQLAEGVRRA